MAVRFLHVTAAGPPRVVSQWTDLNLAQLQRLVGGLIEVVDIEPLPGVPAAAYSIICNAEAALDPSSYQPNPLATTLCCGQVMLPAGGMLGDVVVVGPTDIDGDFTDVPETAVLIANAWEGVDR